MTPTAPGAQALPIVRCAIYTRKSTEEGLDQEFNSLQAQREAAQAYIASQQHAGWTQLPDRYDDGGYTGGNMDRPALAQLLRDIAAGRVNCVVVYKVDRLSRSLVDFAKMMELFEQHQVAFVSVTQQFNTATSMGRLVLHILLSFAQFEREIISERTRDKIAAVRRKGKWAGGMPLLGYDVEPRSSKLVVNATEARRVRAIFTLYLEHEGWLPVLAELQRRGWRNKRWRTRKGSWRGGKLFTRNTLRQLLSNVTYRGQIRYRQEVHPGEHAAIVDAALWEQVQARLQDHRPRQGARLGNGALLQGRLRCAPCGCAMVPRGRVPRVSRLLALRQAGGIGTRVSRPHKQSAASHFLPASSERGIFSSWRRICSAPCLQIASSLRLRGLSPSSSLKGDWPRIGPSTASTMSSIETVEGGRDKR